MSKKITLAATALVLVLVMVIGGTLAYFTDKTETATNTFTVGNVAVELEETKDNDTIDVTDEAGGFTYSNIVPGTTYSKEPVITLSEGSQDAWVFAEITVTNYSDLMAMLEKAYELKELDADTYPSDALDVSFLAGSTLNAKDIVGAWLDEDADVFHLVYGLGKTEAGTDYTLFTGVTIPAGLDKALSLIPDDGVNLTVTAYAAQAENVTEKDAFEGFFEGQTYVDRT